MEKELYPLLETRTIELSKPSQDSTSCDKIQQSESEERPKSTIGKGKTWKKGKSKGKSLKRITEDDQMGSDKQEDDQKGLDKQDDDHMRLDNQVNKYFLPS